MPRKRDPKRLDGPDIGHLVMALEAPGEGFVMTLTKPMPAGTKIRIAASRSHARRLNIDAPKSVDIRRDNASTPTVQQPGGRLPMSRDGVDALG